MLEVREMTEQHKAIIAPKVGRAAKPSILLEQVRAAIGTNKTYEIDIPEGMKPATLISELKKAEKELKIKLKIWNRSKLAGELGVAPFVGFVVVDTVPVVAIQPETGAMPLVEAPHA